MPAAPATLHCRSAWPGRGHPPKGLTAARPLREHAAMDANNSPDQAQQGLDAYVRMQKLLELKAQMEQLHAKLEYVRLMLKLGAARR